MPKTLRLEYYKLDTGKFYKKYNHSFYEDVTNELIWNYISSRIVNMTLPSLPPNHEDLIVYAIIAGVGGTESRVFTRAILEMSAVRSSEPV